MTSVMAKKGQEVGVGWLGGWVAGAGNHALTLLLPIKQPLLHKNKKKVLRALPGALLHIFDYT